MTLTFTNIKYEKILTNNIQDSYMEIIHYHLTILNKECVLI